MSSWDGTGTLHMPFWSSDGARNHCALPTRYPLPLASLTNTIPPGPRQFRDIREEQGAAGVLEGQGKKRAREK